MREFGDPSFLIGGSRIGGSDPGSPESQETPSKTRVYTRAGVVGVTAGVAGVVRTSCSESRRALRERRGDAARPSSSPPRHSRHLFSSALSSTCLLSSPSTAYGSMDTGHTGVLSNSSSNNSSGSNNRMKKQLGTR